ncbi:MAG TPA: helix-turn-helix transcriptional regulator [Patescibacteria group bacterium]|nr:helix-turn-helix transcriptional regulator [Patescibacteria group bacterium]
MGSEEKLGKNMKKARKKAGFTQNEIAEKLKITPNHYAKIERGEAKPSYELLEEIVKILRIKSSEVMPF